MNLQEDEAVLLCYKWRLQGIADSTNMLSDYARINQQKLFLFGLATRERGRASVCCHVSNLDHLGIDVTSVVCIVAPQPIALSWHSKQTFNERSNAAVESITGFRPSTKRDKTIATKWWTIFRELNCEPRQRIDVERTNSTFVVKGRKMPAHRSTLTGRSLFWRQRLRRPLEGIEHVLRTAGDEQLLKLVKKYRLETLSELFQSALWFSTFSQCQLGKIQSQQVSWLQKGYHISTISCSHFFLRFSRSRLQVSRKSKSTTLVTKGLYCFWQSTEYGQSKTLLETRKVWQWV